MSIIKLHSINSTNDYLKELSRKESLENYTVVVAENQTKGKGQMGTIWQTESGKNLIISVLIKDILFEVESIFHLNVAISLAVFEVLDEIKIPKLSIKWANDIMSDTKKIAGILIENTFKNDKTIQSIVGIGLNVNQKEFYNLPNASSLSKIMNIEYDLDDILDKIIYQIKENCNLIISNQTDLLWQKYHNNLFKKGIPIAFEDDKKLKFMGIIQGVSQAGKLEVLLEENTIKLFSIKEITMLY